MSLTPYTATDLSRFALRLLHIGAVKIDMEKGFRFKHHEKFPQAPLSPTYVNLRVPENKGTLGEAEVEEVARFMHVYLRQHNVEFDGMCGVPRAGEPFVRALQRRIYEAEKIYVPVMTLGKEEGPEGRRVSGLLKTEGLPRKARILLVDDLITTSLSKLEAIEVLRHEDYLVEQCIVFLDRGQGGPDEMAARGVQLHRIMGFAPLFDIYRHEGAISDGDYRRIMDYQASERDLLHAA